MQPAQLVAELHDDQFELFSNLTVSSGAMVCCVCMNYLTHISCAFQIIAQKHP